MEFRRIADALEVVERAPQWSDGGGMISIGLRPREEEDAQDTSATGTGEADAGVLLYDKHDIWRVALAGSGATRLTAGAEAGVTGAFDDSPDYFVGASDLADAVQVTDINPFRGTEFYNFARRAGKQMVLLVYEGEDHGLREEANQKDYHRRILEWFGHYLKGDPAPSWITEGVSLQDLEEEKRRVGGGGKRAGGHS